MLINSLFAENFRKYSKLEVTDIPANGTITVSGKNESGKTSIGEAICFALFGRTFSLNKNNLSKLVYWGADAAEVRINFTTADDNNFNLYRSVDDKGNVKVKLERLLLGGGKAPKVLEDDTEISKILNKIIGFDYDAFANSFYLVQRELTTPEPQSTTIKKMAGIGDYAAISSELDKDNTKNQDKINTAKPEVLTTQSALDEIKLDETWLPELVDADQTLENEKQQRETLLAELTEDEKQYTENSTSFFGARKKRGFFGFLSFLFFPVMLASLLIWVVNYFRPKLLDNPLINIFGLDELANTHSTISTWLLPVAIITGIGFLISLMVRGKARQTMQALTGKAEDFSKSLQKGHGVVTSDVESVLPERVVSLMQKNTQNTAVTDSSAHEEPVVVKGASLFSVPPQEQFNNLDSLAVNASTYEADPEEINAAVLRLSDTFDKQNVEISSLSKTLSTDIEKEKRRSDDAGKLRATLKSLNAIIKDSERKISVNNTSMGLMQRAAEDSIGLFNKNITEITANSLPKFTNGRYKKVRVADDFTVQVYSDEKRGYMDFDEISSGTQRQIMLALRLAMSEELAKNTGNKQQFIFLDEPFAFFDPQRTQSTLNALPNISDVITQVWIVAQEFPEGTDVDKVINCPTGSAELLA